jgi:ubiquitin carboxyl-terminal hydrolase 25/28
VGCVFTFFTDILINQGFNIELLAFGYMAQCRCDPAYTMEYFTDFYNIFKTMEDIGQASPELQAIVLDERNRARFTADDRENAIKILGFGRDGPLAVELESDVPDEFIADAWKECIKKAWRDPKNGVRLQMEANDAFRIVAETRASAKLWAIWDAGKGKMMSPDKAYETLEIPKEVDDAMLLTVYVMRVCERLAIFVGIYLITYFYSGGRAT